MRLTQDLLGTDFVVQSTTEQEQIDAAEDRSRLSAFRVCCIQSFCFDLLSEIVADYFCTYRRAFYVRSGLRDPRPEDAPVASYWVIHAVDLFRAAPSSFEKERWACWQNRNFDSRSLIELN
ncbi:hypothetical protein ACLOJK_032068 [Asimina triloba]